MTASVATLRESWRMIQDLSAPPSSRVIANPDPRLRDARDTAAVAVFGRDSRNALYAVPSAGALYPFYVLAVIPFGTGAQVYELQRAGSVTPVGRLADVPFDTGPGDYAIAIAAIPWRSIAKYGPRGTLYSLLDAGHALGAVAGFATSESRLVNLNLGPGPAELAECLRRSIPSLHLVGSCVVSPKGSAAVIDGPPLRESRSKELSPDPASDTRPLQRRSDDMFNWVCPAPREKDMPARLTTLLPRARHLLGDARPTAERYREAVGRRQSSRGFADAALPPSALLEALAWSQIEARVRNGQDAYGDIDVTVLAVPSDGAAEQWPTWVRQPPELSARQVVEMCMSQEIVANARAFLLFHAPQQALFSPDGLQDIVVAVATTSQLIQLGCTSSQVGVSTIGGFLEAEWRRVAGLDDDAEIISLIAVGSAAGSTYVREKVDRRGSILNCQ